MRLLLSLSLIYSLNLWSKELPLNWGENSPLKSLAEKLERIPTEQDLKLVEQQLQQDSLWGKSPTKLSEIEVWQKVGPQFSIGKTRGGKALAIYDHTMLSSANLKGFSKSVLGSFGIGKINLLSLIKKLRDFLSYQYFASPQHPKYYELLDQVEKHLRAEKLTELPASLPKDWRKKIKIKDSALLKNGLTRETLNEFLLSDLSFNNLRKVKRKTFQKFLNKTNQFFAKAFQIPQFDILSMSKMKYNHKTEQIDLMINTEAIKDIKTHPIKLVDIKAWKSSFKDALKIYLFEQAATGVIDLFEPKIGLQLLKFTVRRWFDLYIAQKTYHMHMALQLINENEYGITKNPLSTLSALERKNAGNYIHTWRPSLWSLLRRLLFSSKNIWQKETQKELLRAAKNHDHLKAEGWNPQNFLPWFALAKRKNDPKPTRFYSLPSNHWYNKMPLIAVDYKHPNREFARRITFQTISGAINLAPLGFVGTALDVVLDYVWGDEIDESIEWEARLLGSLINYQLNYQKDFKEEIKQLKRRRMIPWPL